MAELGNIFEFYDDFVYKNNKYFTINQKLSLEHSNLHRHMKLVTIQQV